jgi:low affinity Fe/Cu permease
MPETMPDEEVYEEAKKRVKAKKAFYSHLGAYLAVNTILIIIWALSDADLGTANMWFLWPLTIWGAFVLINFLQVFVFKTSVGREKAAIDKEVEKIKREEN